MPSEFLNLKVNFSEWKKFAGFWFHLCFSAAGLCMLKHILTKILKKEAVLIYPKDGLNLQKPATVDGCADTALTFLIIPFLHPFIPMCSLPTIASVSEIKKMISLRLQ